MTENRQQGLGMEHEEAVASEGVTEQVRGAKRQGSGQASPPAKDNQEIGGPKGLEPTRYGDWENNGRCWDF